MSNARRQKTWRDRQRNHGNRPVTVMLTEVNHARMEQISSTYRLPRFMVINHALAWAFGKMLPRYWQELRRCVQRENGTEGKEGIPPSPCALENQGEGLTPGTENTQGDPSG